jgi:hypothetical protein
MRVAAIGAIAGLLGAAAPQSSVDAFATSLVEAIKSRDIARRFELLHPSTRDCLAPETQSYFDWIFIRQTRHSIPASYRLTHADVASTDALPVALLPADGLVAYPVRPSRRVQIDFQTGPASGTTLIIMAALAGDRWTEVLPCPTAEGMARFVKTEAARRELQKRAEDAVSRLKPEERAEVLELLNAGRRIDAAKRFAAISGEDASVASVAVDLLSRR